MFVICQCSQPFWDREHEEVNSRLWSGKVPLAGVWGSDLFMKFWGFSRVAFPAPTPKNEVTGRDFFFNGDNMTE